MWKALKCNILYKILCLFIDLFSSLFIIRSNVMFKHYVLNNKVSQYLKWRIGFIYFWVLIRFCNTTYRIDRSLFHMDVCRFCYRVYKKQRVWSKQSSSFCIQDLNDGNTSDDFVPLRMWNCTRNKHKKLYPT